MRNRHAFLAGSLAAVLCGCSPLLVDGRIASVGQSSAGANTIHDFETARRVAYAHIGELEGLHRLRPENTEALFLLARAWSTTAYAFIQDDYEEAIERGDSAAASYHRRRTEAAFARAAHYGHELLSLVHDGFGPALADADALDDWLYRRMRDPTSAEDLLWIGNAYLGRTEPIGQRLVVRSVELDPDVEFGTGHAVLGGVHARAGELGRSREHFDAALAVTEGRYLPVRLLFAREYHCKRGDRARYFETLEGIVEADDELPDARLANVVAKRRARRYLGNPMWQRRCKFES